MSEMPHAGHDQCQPIFLAVFNTVLIANGTTGLNKGSDAHFMSHLHAVVEGKKRIAGHHGAIQIKIELFGFFHRMTQGIDTAGLSAAFANQLLVFYQGNGVAF